MRIKDPSPPKPYSLFLFIAITSKVVDHAARPRRNVKSNCVPVVNRLLRGWWWWWWWCEYNREACLLNPQNAENGDDNAIDGSDDHEREPQVSLLVILSGVTRRLRNIRLLLQVESGERWWWSFLASLIILPELYFIHRKQTYIEPWKSSSPDPEVASQPRRVIVLPLPTSWLSIITGLPCYSITHSVNDK